MKLYDVNCCNFITRYCRLGRQHYDKFDTLLKVNKNKVLMNEFIRTKKIMKSFPLNNREEFCFI